MHKCYFLAYRVPKHTPMPLHGHAATGGLVIESEQVAATNGDWQVVIGILRQRFHPRPDERLHVEEVSEMVDKILAAMLHDQWESEMADFHELMGCTGS